MQISDVHSGSFWSKDGVKRGIQMILDLKPDAIFFTGDLVNSTSAEFVSFKEMFSQLQAKHGVYSVLGNHDYGDYYRWPDANGITKEQNLQQFPGSRLLHLHRRSCYYSNQFSGAFCSPTHEHDMK